MRYSWVLGLCLAVSGCGGCAGKPKPPDNQHGAPTVETPPADLGPRGIVVEQPAEGESVSGQWVSVAGWFDPKRYAGVLVVGAPVDGFYESMGGGHGALPSAPVTYRKDGRFLAARVPLAEGETRIVILPMPRNGRFEANAELSLTLKSSETTRAPATLTAEPASGEAPLSVSLAVAGESPSGTWEWDFEGDGTFDAVVSAGEKPSYTYTSPGRSMATARTRREGRWVYATAPISVSPGVGAWTSTARASVGQPRAVAVVPDYLKFEAIVDERLATPPLERKKGSLADQAGGEMAFTRYVLVADGDEVKVFDARLQLLRTLTGLSAPRGVAGDELGRIYVADTGNDRVVRFTADGQLDTTFGVRGSLRGPADAPFRKPALLLQFWNRLPDTQDTHEVGHGVLVQEEGGRLLACEETENSGHDCFPVPLREKTLLSSEPSGALDALARVDTAFIWRNFDAPRHSLFPFVAAQGNRLLSWDALQSSLDVEKVGAQSRPVTALAAASAINVPGMAYVATTDANGMMYEWIVGSETTSPLRQQHVPFPVTAMAIDHHASNEHALKAGLHRGYGSGPIVLYLAGPGRIERFVLPSLPWKI